MWLWCMYPWSLILDPWLWCMCVWCTYLWSWTLILKHACVYGACIYDAIFFGDILSLGGAAAGANKAILGVWFEQAPKWEGSLKAWAVYLVTREHGAGVQCLKRNNWWEEGEIGLIKYSTLETQSATILQVCKVLTSLADDESPSRWKWNTREREILEQQSGVWGGVGTSGPISN